MQCPRYRQQCLEYQQLVKACKEAYERLLHASEGGKLGPFEERYEYEEACKAAEQHKPHEWEEVGDGHTARA